MPVRLVIPLALVATVIAAAAAGARQHGSARLGKAITVGQLPIGVVASPSGAGVYDANEALQADNGTVSGRVRTAREAVVRVP